MFFLLVVKLYKDCGVKRDCCYPLMLHQISYYFLTSLWRVAKNVERRKEKKTKFSVSNKVLTP